MRHGFFVLPFVGLLGFTSPGLTGEYSVMGVGLKSCRDMVQDINKPEVEGALWLTSYFSWAQGYISGLNMGSMKENFGAIDMGSMATADQRKFLADYCRSNGSREFIEAVDELSKRLDFVVQR